MTDPTKNRYVYLSGDTVSDIDVFNPQTIERGVDFYIDVFRYIEESGCLNDFTFYIATVMPELLPSYGSKVVLVVLSDEHYLYKPYFAKIACIIRSYGAFPTYRDGFPINQLQLLSFLQYLYKMFECTISLLQSIMMTKRLSFIQIRERILHVPIGCFFRFDVINAPIKERDINYAFLGSIDYDPRKKKLLHRIFQPPKLVSRNLMMKAIDRFQLRGDMPNKIFLTGDFEESIKNRHMYLMTLENCRISICPRGSNLETYRFFESMKSGCVVVCEPLPDTWFYREHPGITIKNWDELPSVLSRLLSDENLMQQISDDAVRYWNRCASEAAVGKRVIDFIDSL